jgi:hypothetical protein
MFWLSVWDDVHLLNKKFKEDYLTRKFLTFIFKNKFSTFLKKMNYSTYSIEILEKFNINLSNFLEKESFPFFLRSLSRVPNFLSKIFILRFQKWVCISLKIYTPSNKKKKTKKKKNNNLILTKNYANSCFISFFKKTFNQQNFD